MSLLPPREPLPPSQKQNLLSERLIRVEFLNDKAYWIDDNTLYEALYIGGEILQETTKPVNGELLSDEESYAVMELIDRLK